MTDNIKMKNSFLTVTELVCFLDKNFNGLPKGIIFDCDGVLIDSRQSNDTYYATILDFLGLPPLGEAQKDFCHRHSSDEVFSEFVPDYLHEKLTSAKEYVEKSIDIFEMITLMDGVDVFLNAIKNQCKCGIHTNRSHTLNPILERLSIKGYFSSVKTTSYIPAKPNPTGTLEILKEWELEPQNVLYIGDTKLDKSVADVAGIPFYILGTVILKEKNLLLVLEN